MYAINKALLYTVAEYMPLSLFSPFYIHPSIPLTFTWFYSSFIICSSPLPLLVPALHLCPLFFILKEDELRRMAQKELQEERNMLLETIEDLKQTVELTGTVPEKVSAN